VRGFLIIIRETYFASRLGQGIGGRDARSRTRSHAQNSERCGKSRRGVPTQSRITPSVYLERLSDNKGNDGTLVAVSVAASVASGEVYDN